MQFKQFFLHYSVDQVLRSVSSADFSSFENNDLSLDFTMDEIGADKRYQVKLSPKKQLTLDNFYIVSAFDYKESRGVFCNGFQSWTETKIFPKEERLAGQKRYIKKIAQAYGDGLFYDYKNKEGVAHSWTYTYIKLPKRKIFFLGSLNDTEGYTFFEHHANEHQLLLSKECKGKHIEHPFLLLDIFVAQSEEDKCFHNYFELQQLSTLKVQPAMGWTSWYYHYNQINEKIIEDNLKAFSKHKVPIEIFQIDDGFQKAVGDWLNFNDRFPNGVKGIVEKIHAQDIKAGLWLAPLTCEHDSFIVNEKPDWILKDKSGAFLKIGFNPMWSYWFYALDIYNQEVQAYIKKVFDTVFNDWKLDMVKLDFLYGTALVPRNGKSRGEIMHDAMQFLRTCAGDKIILGCGVPLCAAVGTTDYCRIGPDIHLNWDFSLLKWINARERPSVKNAIHNTISRRQLSGKWFWNDPDVLLLRKNKNKLTTEEQYSLLLANLLFGHLLFTSDNIEEYDEHTLQIYKSIFPLMQVDDVRVGYDREFYTIDFRVKNKNYLALINVSDTSKMYRLPKNLYFDNTAQNLINGDKVIEIPKHSSKCYLNIGHTPFSIAGSKGHFFAGAEVEQLYLSNNQIELDWTDGILNSVTLFIKIPNDYQVESVNGSKNFSRIEKGEYAILQVEKDKL